MDDMNNLNQNPQQIPPQPGMYVQPEVEPVMTLGDWLVTLLILLIPCANIVMLFVWAFGSSTPRTKSNWAKAMLIFYAISIVLGLIAGSVLGASVASLYG